MTSVPPSSPSSTSWQTFGQYDHGGTFDVSDAEAQQIMLADFPQLGSDAIANMVKQADADGDGKLSDKELAKMAKALVKALEGAGIDSGDALAEVMGMLGLNNQRDAMSEQQANNALNDLANGKPTQGEGGTDQATAAGQAAAGSAAAQGADSSTTALQGAQNGPFVQGTPGISGTSYDVASAKQDIENLAGKGAGGEGAAPISDSDAQTLAQGIIDGVNAYAPATATPQEKVNLAKQLIASAYKESKFGAKGRDGGGMFQCAQNRYADYVKQFGSEGIPSYSGMGTLSSSSIQVSIWAMMHPASGLPPVGGVAVPPSSNLGAQALYYWNYNPAELQSYMSVTGQAYGEIGGT